MIVGPVPPRSGTIILVGLITIFIGFYVASVGPYWNISPDSATYVGWARSLAAGREWGSPPPIPPVTSLVFAAVLTLFPAGYVALNVATKLLIFGGLALAFVLVRRHAGPTVAALAVLLSLASTQVYHASVQLLSEPAYMFLSMAALVMLDVPATVSPDAVERSRVPRLQDWISGALLLAVVMTRTIGITLPLAVLLVEGKALADRRGRLRLWVVLTSLLAISAVFAWEAYARQGYAAGWLRMFLLVDPWTPSAGKLSAVGLLHRMHDNIGLLAAASEMILNSWSSGHHVLDLLLRAAGTLTCASGLYLTLRRRVTVDGVYVVLYVLIVSAHMLAGGDGDSRYLVPVAPLLFYYVLEAARRLVRRATRARVGPLPAMALTGMGAVYLIGYIDRGVGTMTIGVGEAHSSPFGDYPIKRPANYDAERLALWLKDHSRPDDRYAAGMRDMFDVISERRGYDILPARTSPPAAFVAWLEQQRVRYLLLDRSGSALGDSLVAVVRAYPRVFRVVAELPLANLYEVIPRQDRIE